MNFICGHQRKVWVYSSSNQGLLSSWQQSYRTGVIAGIFCLKKSGDSGRWGEEKKRRHPQVRCQQETISPRERRRTTPNKLPETWQQTAPITDIVQGGTV